MLRSLRSGLGHEARLLPMLYLQHYTREHSRVDFTASLMSPSTKIPALRLFDAVPQSPQSLNLSCTRHTALVRFLRQEFHHIASAIPSATADSTATIALTFDFCAASFSIYIARFLCERMRWR